MKGPQPQATAPGHAQQHEAESERGAEGRRTKRGSTTNHGTTAHTEPPRTHKNTQTPHRHHTHHPHPHPAARPMDGPHTHTHTPAPTASERRAPATRPTGGQPGEGERLTPGVPSQRRGAPPPPPGTPSRHAHSAQRRLGKSARCGTGAWSPRQHHPRPGKTGNGALPTAHGDGRPGEGKRLTPEAPHNGERSTPLGRPPATPAARSPLQGTHAKGTVLGPHARTPAPTARGQRTSTARPEGGQPAERLTSDAPHDGTRHPPRGHPVASPTARNAGSQERTLWGRCWGPTPHNTTCARKTRATGPGCPPPGTGGRERESA